jgi:hypothetical protein
MGKLKRQVLKQRNYADKLLDSPLHRDFEVERIDVQKMRNERAFIHGRPALFLCRCRRERSTTRSFHSLVGNESKDGVQ